MISKWLALLSFLLIFFAALILLGYFKDDREPALLRLRRKIGPKEDRREILNIEKRRSRLPFESFRQWLSQSGFEAAPAVFFAASGTLGLVIYTILAAGFKVSAILAAAASLSAMMTPFAAAAFKRQQRLNLFSAVFPDVIGRLTSSLQAGYSLQMAIESVVQEDEPLIAEEFGRVLHAMAVGQAFEEALKKMLLRVDTVDLRLFITSVTIQRESGGNLVEILNNLETTIRERFQLKRELGSASAQARFSGIVLMLLPLFVGGALFFINREHMMFLFEDPVGKKLFWASVFSQFAGMLTIRKIVRLEI